ncbi:MAG TPA: tetratricopeptide repeat protein [Verrucomicrobiota bacterium]|nr:tetratricopeptide repeat protein [Verrucomicrobiota bacterium]
MPAVLYKTRLPWILGLIFFGLYLLTLNHWVSVETLGILAQVVGWDFWGLRMTDPIFRLLTLPFQFVPQSTAILGISVLNAVLASFSIAWLARAVMLLPQDRSTDQRVRNADPDGLYVGKLAFLPPTIAALSLGLLFHFWQGATEATSGILNIFFLAYIIRNTLEHRLDGEYGWIYRASALYSIALVNNPFMVLLLPFWVGSLIWINGKDLLKYRDLIVRSFFCFLPGLLFFLYIPVTEYIAGRSDMSFFQLLSKFLGVYVQTLKALPLYILFIYSTFSLLPLILLSIRWDQTRSDNSGLNTAITRLGVRAMNLFFFLYTMAIAFDLPLCPRYLSPGVNGLEFHFIAALVLGFTTGYLLVVFHSPVTENRQKRFPVSRTMHMVRPLVYGLVPVFGLVMAVGLVYQNYPVLRENRGETLYQLGCNLVEDVKKAGQAEPGKPITLLSDDPNYLYLVQATLARQGDQSSYILIDSRFLSYPWYHRRMTKYFPDRWPDFVSKAKNIAYLDSGNMINWLMYYAGREKVYYLHPSFGHFFEACRPTLEGLLTRMTPYRDADMSLWIFTDEQKEQARNYWAVQQTRLDAIPAVSPNRKLIDGAVAYTAAYYARALNNYAVEFDKVGDRSQALKYYDEALRLFPRNLSALMNRTYYQRGSLNYSPEEQRMVDELFNSYDSSWNRVEQVCGKLDVPGPLYELGTIFMHNQQWRQAYQSFLRVEQFEPNNSDNMGALAYVDSMIGEGQRALERIRKTKARYKELDVPLSEWVILEIQEAACLISTGQEEEALKLMLDVRKSNPQNTGVANMLIRAYIANKNFSEALFMIDRQLASAPDNAENIRRKVYCLLGLQRPAEALPLLDGLLRKNPSNNSLRILRVATLIQMNLLQQARDEYMAMLEEDQNNLVAILGLAEVSEQMELKDEAIGWFSRALTNAYILDEEVEVVKKRIEDLKTGAASAPVAEAAPEPTPAVEPAPAPQPESALPAPAGQ